MGPEHPDVVVANNEPICFPHPIFHGDIGAALSEVSNLRRCNPEVLPPRSTTPWRSRRSIFPFGIMRSSPIAFS
jgi:hypothetical protein